MLKLELKTLKMVKLKSLIILAIYLLIALPSISQTTSKKDAEIKAAVTEKGDTIITIPYDKAKQILIGLTLCDEVEAESLTKDTLIDLLKVKINLKDSIIAKHEERYQNCFTANQNCVAVINNQTTVIDELRNQVRKEKRNKIIAIVSGSLLTVLAILAF